MSFLKYVCFLCLSLFAMNVSFADEASDEKCSHGQAGASSLKPNIFILYGPPGSGRAKVGVKLHAHFAIPNISFSELLTEAMHEDSAIGVQVRDYMSEGGEIPIALFWKLLNERMQRPDCRQGCLWEGIPWTVEQAALVQKNLAASFQFVALAIAASSEWLCKRVEGRLFCRVCGRVYNQDRSVPRTPGICDICGHELQKRKEDSAEYIASGYQTYQKTISPVLQFWEHQKVLKNINGEKPFDDIYSDVLAETCPLFRARARPLSAESLDDALAPK